MTRSVTRPDSDEGSRILFGETSSAIGAIAAIALCVFGTLFNLYTIIALYLSKLRRHPTTLCVISLAISDLIFSAFNLPVMAHRFLHRGCEFMCLDYHICQMFPFTFFGNIGVSLYIMVLIAVMRVFGVFKGSQLLNTVFSYVNVVFMIIGIWVFSFGFMCFPLTGSWGQFGFEPQTFSCTVVEKEGERFYHMMVAFGVVLPIIIIGIAYGAIWWQVRSTGVETRRAAKNRASSVEIIAPNAIFEQTRERERRITKCFSCIFITFLVCFTPWALVSEFDPMPPSDKDGLHMASYILSWCSAVVNPIIYCLTNKSYQDAFKKFGRKLVPTMSLKTGSTRRTDLTSDMQLIKRNSSLQHQFQQSQK